MSWTDAYFRLRYDAKTFNCFAFYRLLLKDRLGVEIDAHEDAGSALRYSRRLKSEQSGGEWIAVAPNKDREGDLVLMHGIVGRGRTARAVPLHCGYVTAPGWMIDLDEESGVQKRAYRDLPNARASALVRTRVLGVYRHRALA